MLLFVHPPDGDHPPGPTPADEHRCDVDLSDLLDEVWDSPWARALRVLAPPDPDADAAPEPDDAALLARILDAESLLTQLAAVQARDLQALRQIRVREQVEVHGPLPPSSWVDPDGWVAAEAGFALGLTQAQVRRTLDFGAGLSRYRRVATLVDAGGTTALVARRLVDHLDTLGGLVSVDRLDAVEALVVAWLSERPRTVAALDRRMRRLILQAQAGGGTDDDLGRRHADRRVEVTCRGDGTAELWALLPEADALALAQALDAAAPPSWSVGGDDERTRAQRRADLLVSALTGAPAGYGRPEDVPAGTPPRLMRTVLQVSVPVQTLLGGADCPGEVPGLGLISAGTVRDLAAEAATGLQALLYAGPGGRLVATAPVTWLDHVPASPGYAHPARIESALRSRDRRCRAPGCERSARRCDADHVTPWPAGPTSLGNSCCLCRYHHRMKTHAPGWSVTIDGEADLTWTSPSGTTHTTTAHDFREDEGLDAEQDRPPF
jgi:hypothetical protein